LLGPPCLERDGVPLGFDTRKNIALIVYLAVTGESHSREALITLLWPELEPSRARAGLRRNLSTLKKALGGEWLVVEREIVGTDPSADLWLDVDQFRSLLRAWQDHGHPEANVCPECLDALAEAVDVCRGDFLEGFSLRDSANFDEWQFFQTESLRQELASALERLVHGHSGQGAYRSAIPYARRWLALDPLHEPVHRHLMRLYAWTGRRAAALRQYGQCERVLQEELGMPPEEETTQVYEAIKERRDLPEPGARLATRIISQTAALHDRYRLGAELGRGGMGVVYRAHDRLLDRDVAVKVLGDSGLGVEGRARLMHEARSAASLNHPNIVTVHDVGEADGSLFIVMELVEGPSLHDRRPQAPDDVLAIARQICAALEHAHGSGIVHRDLKPENVLLAPDGTAKLVDFGLARSVASRLTSAGTITGTVFYLAPELAMGQDFDGRADLYALGVVLYELTTGRLPFVADDPIAVITQHLHAPVVPPRAKNPRVPPALDALIVHLLRKAPEDRPASATEVLRVLEQPGFLEDDFVPAEELSVLERIERGRLVGREREVQDARALWKRALSGQGQMLLISGEPGIGKTRLARELVTQVEVSGGRALVGASYAEGGTPYAPFRQIIREVLRSGSFAAIGDGFDGSTEPMPRDVVQLSRDAQAGGLAGSVPEFVLADLLTLAPELRPYYPDVLPNPPLDDPKAEQHRLFENTVIFFTTLTDRAPLLLVLEDAHWADSGTLSLLRHLARHTRRQRAMIVATHREAELDKARPLHEVLLDLNRERLATCLQLPRLDREQTREMLAVLFAEEITPEFLEGIYRETEGNPFFIEEVCKALVESGKLYYKDGHWDRPSMEELGIPRSVRVAIQARVGKLPTNSQETLRLAAVLGREFDFDTLAEASELDEDTLTDGLESAERAQLVEEVSGEGGGTFAFVHGLIPSTLVEGLRTLQRRRLHRRAAAATEILRPNDFEALAYHYNQAGEPEKAIDYLLQAGDRARRLGVSLEAIDFYQLALQKATELKAPREAIELHRIHERLGDVYLVNLSRHDEALEHYRSFLDLAQSEKDEVRGARKVAGVHLLRGDLTEAQRCYETALARLSSLPPLPEASRVHHGFSHLLTLRSRWDEAAQHAAASLEISRRIGDTRGLADAYRLMSAIAKQRGDLEAACRYDENCLELYRELGDLPRTAQALNNVGDSYRLLGQMDRALEHLTKGLELVRRIGDPRDEAVLLQTTAELFLDQGQWESAITHLERALPLAEESGAAARMIEVHWILGSAYERVGQLEGAQHHLEMAETLSRDTQHLQFAPRIYLDLARLNATQGEFDQAQRCVQLALDAAGSEPSDVFFGLVHRCYGYLCSRHSDWDDAVRHLEESLKLLERTNLPVEVGKTRLSLGTAYATRDEEGDRGRACEHLLAAQSMFRQIQARGYLARVDAQLRELGCQSDSPDALLGGDAPPTGRAAAEQLIG